MLTKPIASAFWAKFCAAPAGHLASPEMSRLVSRAIALVKEREGQEEALVLRQLVDVAVALDMLGV